MFSMIFAFISEISRKILNYETGHAALTGGSSKLGWPISVSVPECDPILPRSFRIKFLSMYLWCIKFLSIICVEKLERHNQIDILLFALYVFSPKTSTDPVYQRTKNLLVATYFLSLMTLGQMATNKNFNDKYGNYQINYILR